MLVLISVQQLQSVLLIVDLLWIPHGLKGIAHMLLEITFGDAQHRQR